MESMKKPFNSVREISKWLKYTLLIIIQFNLFGKDLKMNDYLLNWIT